MYERVQVLDDATHKVNILTAAGTTTPPVNPTDGAAMSAWQAGSTFNPRRTAVRFVASQAANLTALSVWVFYGGGWSKIATPANITFVAGDLSFTAIVDFPFGSRIAVAYTLSAGAVTVDAFPVETHVC
jgi:hypothetical protein